MRYFSFVLFGTTERDRRERKMISEEVWVVEEDVRGRWEMEGNY
jgi:hypothetical protein